MSNNKSSLKDIHSLDHMVVKYNLYCFLMANRVHESHNATLTVGKSCVVTTSRANEWLYLSMCTHLCVGL